MKRTSLLLAILVLAAAAKSPAQADLIARVHFAGADRLSADTNHLGFTNLFCSAEARALESHTLDRLSRVPGAWFKSKLPPGASDGVAQLRPLLDDFLKSEWVLEIRDATNGSPEYALAIRLSEDRAQLWSKNLATLLQGWTGIGISQDKPGIWRLKKHQPPDLFQFSRSGDWVVIDCGQDKLSLAGGMLQGVAPNNGWLSVEANWPRLAQIFPALKEIDLPKIQMQIVGHGGNLQMVGKLSLAQALAPLEKWQMPTSVIRQPLVSFTAARGVTRWLVKQPWMRPFLIQPQPDQLFIWALARIPFQTFAAEPVPDAKAALAQLVQQLPADSNWHKQFMNPFAMTNANDEISWLGMPFLSPFVKAVHEPAGDFVFGGFFPNTGPNRPLPPELLATLNQSNLVYYHWEITGERLQELPQLSQLLLMFTRHRQLDGQSAASQWLNRISPALGICVTEITQTAPNELVFKRRAPGGLTAIELLAFANWLEAPGFPALDLRLPPPPPRRGGPALLPAAPPVVPAPPHP